MTIDTASHPTTLIFGLGSALTLFSWGIAFAPSIQEPVVISTNVKIHEIHCSAMQLDPVAINFRHLVERWKEETNTPSSDFNDIVTHWAYQQIIALGWKAVPLILDELKERPDHWGWALEAITGRNPVPPDSFGNGRGIAVAWLEWGRDNLFIS